MIFYQHLCFILFYSENVLSPTRGVTVFPTELDSSSNICVTEVAYEFSQNEVVNKTEICFQSTLVFHLLTTSTMSYCMRYYFFLIDCLVS